VPRPLRAGADVEHLVARDRTYVEPVVFDWQYDDRGLELAASDAFRRPGRIAAHESHGHLGVPQQEGGHQLVQPPGRRRVERPEGHDATAHRRQLADALGGVLERTQRANGVCGEDVPGVGRNNAAAGADEQVGTQRPLQLANLLGDRGL
jgi:hypothetical protein